MKQTCVSLKFSTNGYFGPFNTLYVMYKLGSFLTRFGVNDVTVWKYRIW